MKPGFREVWSAYEACRRRKRNRPDAIRFEMRALDEAWGLTSRLASGRYVPSRPVCFVANESKPREVFAAAFRDRVVHHLLVSVLEPFFERRFIHDSFACRRRKGTHRAVERLTRFLRAATLHGRVRAYALHLDVRNFFPSIHKGVLWGIVERQCRHFRHPMRQEVLSTLRTVVFHDPTRNFVLACPRKDIEKVPAHKRLGALGPERGLPIGNLTSQFLANVLLNELDQFVKHTLKARWYVRYVDDLVLVHRDPAVLEEWGRRIEGFLQERLSLSLNQDATRLVPVSRGVDFLGYVVRPRYRLVRRRVVGHLWNRLVAFERQVLRRDANIVDLEAARACGLVETLNSYLGHFRHARTARTLIRLALAFPWLRDFVSLRPGKRGGFVAGERFKPPRSFPSLWFQWSFFRRQLAQEVGEHGVLFLQVGRFFEMFEQDAEWGRAELGLRSLEPRDGFRARCGFRRGDLDRFTRRALELGRVVMVVVETGHTLGRVKERLVRHVMGRSEDEAAMVMGGDADGARVGAGTLRR